MGGLHQKRVIAVESRGSIRQKRAHSSLLCEIQTSASRKRRRSVSTLSSQCGFQVPAMRRS
jgi:hypothetical protein